MSAYASFLDLLTAINECFDQKDYPRGMELVDREGGEFPEFEPNVIYLRACLAARLKDQKRSFQEIQNALDKGYWYSEMVMRKTPSWVDYKGLPEFERLVEENVRCEKQVQALGPQMFVEPPEGGFHPGEKLPLLAALHGNGDYAANTLQGWHDVTRMGWILAALQSSQVIGYNLYVWDDDSIVDREVPAQIDQLLREYPVDLDRSVLAGFSRGGVQALRLVLQGRVPMKRFLLLGPGSEPMSLIDELVVDLTEAAKRDVRGAILYGEKDEPDIIEKVKWLVPVLNEGGVPTRVEVLPGKGHAYPNDGGGALERSLEFLSGR